MTLNLFDFAPTMEPLEQSPGAGATLLRGFARSQATRVLEQYPW
jgi:hypothetical protein